MGRPWGRLGDAGDLGGCGEGKGMLGRVCERVWCLGIGGVGGVRLGRLGRLGRGGDFKGLGLQSSMGR